MASFQRPHRGYVVAIPSSHILGQSLAMVAPPRVDPIFKLRLPDYLRERLEKEAADGRRSLTAEILGRLEASFSETNQRLNALEKVVDDGAMGNQVLLGILKWAEDRIKKLEELTSDDDHGNQALWRHFSELYSRITQMESELSSVAEKAGHYPPDYG